MPLYYEDDFVTLYHGDCLTEHREWLDADVLVTDPPYGYSHKSGGGPRGNASWKNTSIANDQDTEARDAVLSAWGVKPSLVFGSWKKPKPDTTHTVLVWDKGDAAGMGDLSVPWKPNYEEIYVSGKGFKGKRETSILRGHTIISWESSGRTHPHEKPSSLMQALIAKCPIGVIADPFAGSGTTLYAAKALGRKVTGVELEEKYCEIIAKRCSQEVLDLGAIA
jgi:DNA modification methylase